MISSLTSTKIWLFTEFNDEFYKRQTEIVGLYINPPENSLVVCLDEKPAIQALERRHQSKEMRSGKPQKRDFNYVRHGVLNLFAAFNVLDGKVYGKTAETKKAPDFLAFMKDVYSRWSSPTRELHFIMDNYGTHTSEIVTDWVKEHPDVQLHFTPTHASWLNQIELWFSILYRQALARGDFKSKDDLAGKLISFIEQYNIRAKPFAWTYKGTPLRIT